MEESEKVVNGLKVVSGYLDMKSYTDNIAFNLIQHIEDALKLIESQKQEIAFLKGMQLQMLGNFTEEELGRMVSRVLPR